MYSCGSIIEETVLATHPGEGSSGSILGQLIFLSMKDMYIFIVNIDLFQS